MITSYNSVGRKRLLKLAEHLEHGKLGHKEFDFSVLNTDKDGDDISSNCGYAGCALGECPIVWPRSWKFSKDVGVKLCSKHLFDNPGNALDSASIFFCITTHEAEWLFVPKRYRPWAKKAGFPSCLDRNASRREVARSIRQFVKWKDAGHDFIYDC